MHEFSLALGLLEQVEKVRKENSASRVLSIEVEIGAFAGVVIDSFRFAFDSLKKERQGFETAHLVVIEPDPRFFCLECGCEFEVPKNEMICSHVPFLTNIRCPECRHDLVSPRGGSEILLKTVEME